MGERGVGGESSGVICTYVACMAHVTTLMHPLALFCCHPPPQSPLSITLTGDDLRLTAVGSALVGVMAVDAKFVGVSLSFFAPHPVSQAAFADAEEAQG